MDSQDFKAVSYHYIRSKIQHAIETQHIDASFQPTILLAASADALAIARILRDELKAKTHQAALPVLTSNLLLFDDSNPYRGETTSSWSGTFSGQRILVVDKADSTRSTVVNFITFLRQGRFAEENKAAVDGSWVEPKLAVFVMHNKRRAKAAVLPEDVIEYVGEESDDVRIAYATSLDDAQQPQAHHHHASGTQHKPAKQQDLRRTNSRPSSPVPPTCQGLLRSISSHYVETILEKAVDDQHIQERFGPTIIVAASDGALAPARLLRQYLRFRTGHPQPPDDDLPVLTPRLELYDEGTNPYLAHITGVKAWGPMSLAGQRVLVVDRADSTRTTLSTFIAKLESLTAGAKADAVAAGVAWAGDPVFGVFVLHNKQVEKQQELPADILNGRYFYGELSDGSTVLYPFSV